MPSHAFLEGAADPRSTVDELLHWVLGMTLHCACAIVAGALAARIMRAMHLHWSWAAGGFVLLVLAAPGLPGWALTAALASLLATVRGRRWHREDVDSGGDLGDLAARRWAPLGLALVLVRAALLGLRERHGVARRVARRELALGLDESGRSVSIPLCEHSGGAHALVVGATGSGKTVTQTWIAIHAIERGMGAIVVDPKGDGSMREHLRRAAWAAGRHFIEWTPAGSSVYNPYAFGGASEIADKALAAERFTEPHYLRQAQRYLGHAVRALRQSGTEVSPRAIVEHMDPARLELLARALPDAERTATFAYLDSLSSRQHSELAGVRDRLAIVAESDVGPWLDPQTLGAEHFDLLSAVRRRAVVYFRLDADSRPLLAQMIAAAVILDLQTTAARLQASPLATLVVIDEFSAIAAEQVVRLFSRARSAGFSLLLGTQEISDLRLPGHERLVDQVLGNLSVLIAHRQVVPSSAELISSVAGTKGAWRVSRHSDGRTTRSRTREPVLDPGRVMSLGRGWGVVLELGDCADARIARMFSPARRR